MKRLQISQKLVYEKFYVQEKFYVREIAAVNLSKIYFLKNAKKTSKPNNRDLNGDWIKRKYHWHQVKFDMNINVKSHALSVDSHFFTSSLWDNILELCAYDSDIKMHDWFEIHKFLCFIFWKKNCN